jgi:hypothetical protein
MTLRPAILACAALAACSSTQPAPPDTFVDMNLSAMSGQGDVCPLFSTSLTIGTPTGLKPTTVPNGGKDMDGDVNVACSVKGSGSYQIALLAQKGATHGGSLSISGKVDGSGGQVAASFTSQMRTYQQRDCMLTYQYGNPPGPIPIQPPIAGGRIWAHLFCPMMTDTSGGMQLLADGGFSPVVCTGKVDFLFENCDQ